MNVGYILLRGLKVENATAMHYGLTYGFPSLTGILGAIHAASREVCAGKGLFFDGVLVACRRCENWVWRDGPYQPAVFMQQGQPLLRTGASAPIIEEGRCHVELSLCVEVLGESELTEEEGENLAQETAEVVESRRFAGGVVYGFAKRRPVSFFGRDALWDVRKLLFPSFVLMQRNDMLKQFVERLNLIQDSTGLDALIEMCVLNRQRKTEDDDWITYSNLQKNGWLVPLLVGYRRISPLYAPGEVKESRKKEYPAAFVEGAYTVGQWVFPHRIEDLDDAFWRHRYQEENGLYLVSQNQHCAMN